jgi:hypothetical protein
MDDRPTDNIKDFEYKFDARVEDSKEYKQYVRRMPYHMWDGKVPFDIETQVVPMKSIHLTTDNLERLIKEQYRMEELKSESKYAKEILSMLRADEQVRENNPAVQKAWRNYTTLLELARK